MRRSKLAAVGISLLAFVLTAAACSGGDDASGERSSSRGEIPQPTQDDLEAAGFEELPLAAASDRVDIVEPAFSHPLAITNPMFPISDLQSVIFSGVVDDKPFHTETTLLPQTRIIEWAEGKRVETRVSQYFAYVDGRIEEVALDYYAQADDGAVWYFGEDLVDFNEEGFVDSTEGVWLAGVDGPPAMIMPGDPQVGDVHRAENTPPIAFEEVEVTSVDETLDGPTGPVDGAIIAREMHLDGTFSDKNFAPGYGEFYSEHEGEIEALALAVPTDALDAPVPDELATLATGADDMFAAIRSEDWEAAGTAIESASAAWDTLSAGEVPPYLKTETDRALAGVGAAVTARDQGKAATAAINVAQSALDLQLRYTPPTDIDRARFGLWARQILADARAGNTGGVRGDITTMEFVRDRFVDTLDQPDVISIDVSLMALRETVNDGDLPAAETEAQDLLDTLADIQPSS
jgi:hypothetical protein